MKIIIVGAAYPFRGGIAHHTGQLAMQLSRTHSVEVVTFRRQYPKLLFPGKTQLDPGAKPLDVPTYQWIDSLNPLNWVLTARRLRKKHADVLIFSYSIPFFGPCYGVMARLARRKTKARILFLCHNILPHEKRMGDTLLIRYALGAADYFIVQSSTVEKELLQLFPGARYRLAHHPLYGQFGEPLSKEEARAHLDVSARKVMLYFGYVRPYKGLMVLIEAMKNIAERGTDIFVLIVGEFYDDEGKYKKRVEEWGLSGQIRFVSDYVPNDQVRFYFSAADVVVLPYLSASQSGITQIAYHFDKPVIATDVGGLAEVVLHERTGYTVPPNDPVSLAQAIKRFYDEGKEEELTRNVRIEKKKYSWENFVQQIEALVS